MLDIDKNKRMCLSEYLLFKFQRPPVELILAPQGDPEELAKAILSPSPLFVLSPCFQCKIIIYYHTYDTNILFPLFPLPSIPPFFFFLIPKKKNRQRPVCPCSSLLLPLLSPLP